MINLKQKDFKKKRLNPFKYSLSDFLKLTDKEQNQMLRIADAMNSVFVNKYFKEHPNIDWFVIAKEPKKVIAAGISKDEPFEEDLLELSKKHGIIVFTYSREKIIEEELSLFLENPIITNTHSFPGQIAFLWR